MFSRHYSLRRASRILHSAYSTYQKHRTQLSESLQKELVYALQQLEEAIFAKDKERATTHAKKVEVFCGKHFKRGVKYYALEVVFAIIFALVIATIVRQTWFELYEIPTGSMRPSFKEQDRLIVTKTSFGLNIPLFTNHFYFDEDKIQRGGVVIFSGANIPSLDVKTTYFGLFPYTKRYIKRLIGKPGDTLYFYGGNIYGIDKEGNALDILLTDPWMKKLEHIPFISFEGEYSPSKGQMLTFHHFDQPIGRLSYSGFGANKGEILIDGKWQKETPFDKDPKSYGDFFGIRNFAMARLLNRKELETLTSFSPEEIGEGVLYLQLRHSPNLSYPPPRFYKGSQQLGVQLPTFESVIPLNEEHIQKLFSNLYTSRFVVKNGRARRYSVGHPYFSSGSPLFSDLPDGTYEFYNGKALSVGFEGKTLPLAKDHPLYRNDPERVKELFNMGIEMISFYEPHTLFQVYYPHRYAYFNEGAFYVMGTRLMEQRDPFLQKFIAQEQQKPAPYLPFIDSGPPDAARIKAFGITVPEKHYLVLGDNHSMSGDSRIFGFIPQENLEGTPTFLLWPPGERWGSPPQSSYACITLPRLIVWATALVVFLSWVLYRQRQFSQRLFNEKH